MTKQNAVRLKCQDSLRIILRTNGLKTDSVFEFQTLRDETNVSYLHGSDDVTITFERSITTM